MAINFTVDSAAVPLGATVLGFRAHEALSEPFCIEVALRTTGARIDLQASIGLPLSLSFERDFPAANHVWNGVIAAMELVHASAEVSYWRATVTPKLWNLKNAFHSRVFTVGSVPEIVEAVLLDEGLSSTDFRFELRGSYPSLEHVCMFRESSFDFVSRLLEREGITYYFEHEDDRHVMVLVDDLSAHPEARGAVHMEPYALDENVTREGFAEFSYEHRALASKVVVTDYDYLRPSAEIGADAALQRRPTGVVVEHAEFVPLPEEEKRYADLRAEELLCREQWFQGWGRAPGLRSGFTFAVSGHDLRRLDDEYLVVELASEGFALEGTDAHSRFIARLFELQGKRGVVVNVGAIPKLQQFRPARVTAWPRIHGVVDGVVDGMATSTYAQIDAQGRYKVRLRFDESDLLDGQTSTWIRMLQPHGGTNEGFHFPLRKGTEVQVAFLGGDPDRPAIVAAAHNAIEQSKVRSANGTQNVIHTGGDNTITMEDVAGGQFITTFTPPAASTLHLGAGGNQVELRTDGQGHLHTGASLDVDVFGSKIETVTGTLRETYVGVQTLAVTGPVKRTMLTSQHQTVTGPVKETISGTLTESVTASVTETYHAGQETTVTAGVKLAYDATLAHTVNAAPMDETINGGRFRMVTGPWDHTISGHVTETFGTHVRLVHGDYTETVTGSYTVKAPQIRALALNRDWSDAVHTTTDSIDDILLAAYDLLGSTSISFTGASTSLIKSDLMVAGVQVSLAALGYTPTAVNNSTAGIRIRLRGLNVRTEGLDIKFKGFYVII